MKHFTILLSLFIFVNLSVFAQAKKAESILEKVSEETQSFRSIKIVFNYEMENKEADIHESERGELLVKGEKYRLSIAGQVVINDGENLWTYLADAEEVQVNSIEEDSEGIITPTKLLSTYDDTYKAKLIDEKVWMKTEVYIIELKPKEDKSFDRIELKVDKNKNRLLQILIMDKSGNVFTYTVEEFKPNVLFDSGTFSFNTEDYPDVEVIDMR